MTLDNLSHWLILKLRSARAVWIATLLSVLLFVYSLISFFSVFFISPSATSANEQRLLTIVPVKSQDISQLHLFGEYKEQAALLPKTGLQLKLEGIFYANITKQSQALISSPSSPAKLYQVGDSVLGDAKIEEILHDNVVLERGGKLEVLPLLQPELNFGIEPKDTVTKQTKN